MEVRAVVFDLFGTLVSGFSKLDYDCVLAKMAKVLSAPYVQYREQSGKAYHRREIGEFSSLEASIESVCRGHLGVSVTCAQVEQAAQYHYAYVAGVIVPDPSVTQALWELRGRGLKLGLVSNCGPEAPV